MMGFSTPAANIQAKLKFWAFLSFFFSQWALCTMAIFLFEMSVM
jgi:hypothetical protein